MLRAVMECQGNTGHKTVSRCVMLGGLAVCVAWTRIESTGASEKYVVCLLSCLIWTFANV